MSFHAQFGEDSWLASSLALPQKGTFIEVGAYDGISSSNTHYFEQQGWTGLLVEPDLEIAARCQKNRSSPVIACAVGSFTKVGCLKIRDDDRGQSGLEANGRPVLVPVVRLDELMHASGLTKLDLLSIDTEGTELDAWNSIGSYRPSVVILEYLTWGKPPRDDRIIWVMEQVGYKTIHRTEANLIFQKQVTDV